MISNQITLDGAIKLIERLSDDEYIFIKECDLSVDIVGELLKNYSIFLGPMSPDHWEYKIFNKLGVVQHKNWLPINEDSMPKEWRKSKELE